MLSFEPLEPRIVLAHTILTDDLKDSGPYTPLSDAGYLAFSATPIAPSLSRLGEEWTGWIDVNHPSLDGTTDTTLGYDRSDHDVTIRTLLVTDGDSVSPSPDIAQPPRVNT